MIALEAVHSCRRRLSDEAGRPSLSGKERQDRHKQQVKIHAVIYLPQVACTKIALREYHHSLSQTFGKMPMSLRKESKDLRLFNDAATEAVPVQKLCQVSNVDQVLRGCIDPGSALEGCPC